MGIKTRYVSKRKEEENAHGEGRHDRKILQAKNRRKKRSRIITCSTKKGLSIKKESKSKTKAISFLIGTFFLGGGQITRTE